VGHPYAGPSYRVNMLQAFDVDVAADIVPRIHNDCRHHDRLSYDDELRPLQKAATSFPVISQFL